MLSQVSGSSERIQLVGAHRNLRNFHLTAADDGPALRRNALELYAHLRRTTGVLASPTSYREVQLAQPPAYDEETSLAYLAGLMPSVYGATLHALTMARNRLELLGPALYDEQVWTPQIVLDFGAGTASAAWAVDEVWPETELQTETNEPAKKREYIGLDSSRAMVELGSSLLGRLSSRIVNNNGLNPEDDLRRTGSALTGRMHQLTLPASQSSMARLQIARVNREADQRRTLALCAFALGEIGTKEKRKEMVRALWNTGAEVMVVVDRGTPGGSRIVVEAREQLLMLGKRSVEEETADQLTGAEGAFVLAPVRFDRTAGGCGPEVLTIFCIKCPHDGACPLHHSTKSYCHFSQRG